MADARRSTRSSTHSDETSSSLAADPPIAADDNNIDEAVGDAPTFDNANVGNDPVSPLAQRSAHSIPAFLPSSPSSPQPTTASLLLSR